MKPRKPLERHTPLARGPMPERRVSVKKENRQRRSREFVRCYGSPERCAWIASQPCSVMGCGRRPSENAHAETGGVGRKADAATILSLCAAHHRELHQVGVQTFQRLHSLDLADCARRTAEAWDARQARVA